MNIPKIKVVPHLFVAGVNSWGEAILGAVALFWSIALWLLLPATAATYNRSLLFVSFAGGGGLLLLALQFEAVRVFLDVTLPVKLRPFLPLRWQLRLIRSWRTTTIIRLILHFIFAVFWLLLAAAVALTTHDMTAVRLVLYAGYSALHLDRLLRLIRARGA